MSDVTLTIGGRSYTVACAAGEEAHIAELGRMIDDKLGTLPRGSGKNDSRSLLFATLLLADELHELRTSGIGQLQAATARSPGVVMSPDGLEALADRLEALADAFEIRA